MNRLGLAADLDHHRAHLDRSKLELQARVGPGQGEHPIDQPRHACGLGGNVGRGGTQNLVRDRGSAGEQARVALDRGQRGAQLVGGVSDESALRLKRILELFKHPVEARRKQGDLIAATTLGESPSEVSRAAYVVGGGGDILQRLEGAAGDEPRGGQRRDQCRNPRDD